MAENSELTANNRNVSISSHAQRLPQELDLAISIDLEIGARLAVKMTPWENVQLLQFSGFCKRVEGNVSRTKHIIFGHGHQ